MNRLLAGPGHEHRAHISPSGDGRDDKSRRIKGAYILCSTRPFAGEAARLSLSRALTKILIELA